MSATATAPAPAPAAPFTPDPVAATRPTAEVDNRATYTSFGLAYVLGHGSAAVSQGAAPLLDLPGWLPMTLLGTGLAVGTVNATIAAGRAQRTATDPADILSGKLLGAAWVVAFAALFLAITGLTNSVGAPDLQSMLWPTGSGLVVGLLYLAEGAARRNLLHYGLGGWLALTSTAALLLGTPGLYWMLTVAGGGAYALAAVLERRRLAAR
ncbi:ABC transporter permease [Streptomyces sp. NPDC012623]|uniref:ABC transporter permease n=1 Tax=unclassified Streptomyces TaxID=2593676 RepID=UPI0036813865